MKPLIDIIYEEAEGAATPANTMGMGDPSLPSNDIVGSGDVFPTAKACKERRRKKKKVEESVFDADIDKVTGEYVACKTAEKLFPEFDNVNSIKVHGNTVHVINKWGRLLMDPTNITFNGTGVDEIAVNSAHLYPGGVLDGDKLGIKKIKCGENLTNNFDFTDNSVSNIDITAGWIKGESSSRKTTYRNVTIHSLKCQLTLTNNNSDISDIDFAGQTQLFSVRVKSLKMGKWSKFVGDIFDPNFQPCIKSTVTDRLVGCKGFKATVSTLSEMRSMYPNCGYMEITGPVVKLKSGIKAKRLFGSKLDADLYEIYSDNLAIIFCREGLEDYVGRGLTTEISTYTSLGTFAFTSRGGIVYPWHMFGADGVPFKEWIESFPVTNDGYRVLLFPISMK